MRGVPTSARKRNQIIRLWDSAGAELRVKAREIREEYPKLSEKQAMRRAAREHAELAVDPREIARRSGVSRSTVSRVLLDDLENRRTAWFRRMEPIRWLKRGDHAVQQFVLTKSERDALAKCLGGASKRHDAMVAADRVVRFVADMVRKQTREPGVNARGPNRQAMNRFLYDSGFVFDVFSAEDRTAGRHVRNEKRAEFMALLVRAGRDITSRNARCSLPILKLGEVRTSASTWAVRKAKRSKAARNIGKALRSRKAQPFMHQRIAEWMHARADEEHGMTVARSRELDRRLREEYASRDAMLTKLEEHDEVREGYEVFDRSDPDQMELRKNSDLLRWFEKRLSKRTTARNRFWREHPEEKDLYRKHHKLGTLVADARKDRVLAEELAPLGIELNERKG